jgi:hypothetical protein
MFAAALSAISALLSILAYPFWSLCIFALAIIMLYELARHQGSHGGLNAPSPLSNHEGSARRSLRRPWRARSRHDGRASHTTFGRALGTTDKSHARARPGFCFLLRQRHGSSRRLRRSCVVQFDRLAQAGQDRRIDAIAGVRGGADGVVRRTRDRSLVRRSVKAAGDAIGDICGSPSGPRSGAAVANGRREQLELRSGRARGGVHEARGVGFRTARKRGRGWPRARSTVTETRACRTAAPRRAQSSSVVTWSS